MTPAELELLIRKILGEGVQLQGAGYALVGLVALASAGLGTYAGGYLKRRGENLATKADFDSVLLQLQRQTRDVESIKGEIASASWIHQRRWDVKRQLYSELLVALEELRQKGRWFHAAIQNRGWSTDESRDAELTGYAKHIAERGLLEKLVACKGAAGMVLAPEAATSIDELGAEFAHWASELAAARDVESILSVARYVLPDLLAKTDHTYALVLEVARGDLLAIAK